MLITLQSIGQQPVLALVLRALTYVAGNHHQEDSAISISMSSSNPGQPETNQKGYEVSNNMGTSLMRHQHLVPLPLQPHRQLDAHDLSAEIKFAHDLHLPLQGDLRPVQHLRPLHAGIVEHLHRRDAHDHEKGHRLLQEVQGAPPVIDTLKASFYLKLYFCHKFIFHEDEVIPAMDMYNVSGKVITKKATHTQPLTMVIGIAFSGPHSPLSVGIVCRIQMQRLCSVFRYHGWSSSSA